MRIQVTLLCMHSKHNFRVLMVLSCCIVVFLQLYSGDRKNRELNSNAVWEVEKEMANRGGICCFGEVNMIVVSAGSAVLLCCLLLLLCCWCWLLLLFDDDFVLLVIFCCFMLLICCCCYCCVVV